MKTMSFERGQDPKRAMNIGLIAKITGWLENHHIKNYVVNEDFNIDVEDDVWLDGYHINDVANIPEFVKFGNVTGKFILSNRIFNFPPVR